MIQIQAYSIISGLCTGQPSRKYPFWGLTFDRDNGKILGEM